MVESTDFRNIHQEESTSTIISTTSRDEYEHIDNFPIPLQDLNMQSSTLPTLATNINIKSHIMQYEDTSINHPPPHNISTSSIPIPNPSTSSEQTPAITSGSL
jgi:hypothetical protein